MIQPAHAASPQNHQRTGGEEQGLTLDKTYSCGVPNEPDAKGKKAAAGAAGGAHPDPDPAPRWRCPRAQGGRAAGKSWTQ